MKSHRQVLAERIIRTVFETAKPSGSGGYWSDFGPVTYGEMEYFLRGPLTPDEPEHIDGTEQHKDL